MVFTPDLDYDEILVLKDGVEQGVGLILLGDDDYLLKTFPEEFGPKGNV